MSAESIRSVGGQRLYVEAYGTNAEDVLNKLFGTTITYGLDNPEDEVTGRIWLYDDNDNNLFYGVAHYNKEAFEVGGTPPKYDIWIQRIPILENVRSAEILAIANDGTTANRQHVDVDDNGHVLFPPYLAGAVNGILVTTLKDGSTVTYRLSDGTARPGSEFLETDAQWSIAGHHVFKPSSEKLVVADIVALWEDPTLLITLKVGQTLRLDIKGVVQIDGVVSIERPSSFIYTREEDGFVGSAPGINQGYTDISLPAGTYRFRSPSSAWDKFAQPTTLYTGPIDNGGGFGKGSQEPSEL